jgi:hypothetical protein
MIPNETGETYQKIFSYLVIFLTELEDKTSLFSSNQGIAPLGLVLIDEVLSKRVFYSLISEQLLVILNSYLLKILENETFSGSKANYTKHKGNLMNLILKTTSYYSSLSSLAILLISSM